MPLSRSPKTENPIADPREWLFVSDLDGTLLDPEGKLPPEAISRLNRLIDRGLKFTVATARNYDSAYPLLKGLHLNLPVILFNGVYLTEFLTGRNLRTAPFIARDVVQEMLTVAAPAGIDPFVYTLGDRHRVYYRNAANPGAAAYLNSLDGDGRLHRVERYEVQSLDPISGFLLIDTRSALEPIHEFLAGRFPDQLNLYFAEDLSQRGYHWLQAFHRQADKGRMLETLTQTLPWPRDRVAVFGDNWNDMEMFQAAGKAIAVSNAVSPLRDRAQEVIGSHAEGAVVNYLETLWADSAASPSRLGSSEGVL